MTIIGYGGVVICKLAYTDNFKSELKKLKRVDPVLYERTEKLLQNLLKNPRPAGLRFEKLKGHRNPDIYTVHITGNYKMSLEIKIILQFYVELATTMKLIVILK